MYSFANSFLSMNPIVSSIVQCQSVQIKLLYNVFSSIQYHICVLLCCSYLAEAPYACKEKTGNLLEFIFSIEGQDESSPFYSICFMLPMLSQITMEVDGCKTLASFGGYKAVIDCLVKMTEQDGMVIDNGSMFLACDTIINFMSNVSDLIF